MEARPGGGQEELVGASCNWFLPGVATASEHLPLAALAAGAGVEIVDLEREKTVARLEGHKGRVAAVSFFANPVLSHVLASAAADGNVRLWDVRRRVCVAMRKMGGDCLALALTGGVKPSILVAEASVLHVWEPPASAYASDPHLNAHNTPQSTAESIGAKGKIWAVKTHELKVRGRIVCVASAPEDENLAAIALHSGEILIVNWRSATVHQKLLGHTDSVQSLSFAPPSHCKGVTLLLSGSRDGSLRLWDSGNGLPLQKVNVIEESNVDSGKTKKGKKGKGKKRPPEQQARQSHFWLSSCWSAAERGLILASNGGGQLQEWVIVVKPQRKRVRMALKKEETSSGSVSDESEGETPVKHATMAITSTVESVGEEEEEVVAVPVTGQHTDGSKKESADEVGEPSLREAFAEGRVRLQQGRRLGPGSGGVQHSRPIFCIAPALGLGKDSCISVSMDRQLCVWSHESGRAAWAVPGLGGHAYAVAFSPLHGSLLAVAVGDASVLLWDCETAAGGTPRVPLGFRSRLLWRGVQAKATALAWHPKREGLLAFACEDGRLGVVDVFSGRHRLFASRHRGQVYELQWRAPPSTALTEACKLYSCAADGKIFVSDETKNESTSKSIEEIVSQPVAQLLSDCSDFSWTADGRHLAVATGKGLVLVFSSLASEELEGERLQLKAVLRRHKSTVLRVSWRGLSADETNYSAIATCCRDGVCFVHDVSSLRLSTTAEEEPMKESDDGDVVMDEEEAMARHKGENCGGALLEGHSGAVTQALWSPWTRGQLLTSSFDGTVQLWNAEERTALVSCRGHSGRVLDCAFSPLSPHFVVSASDDQSVRVWDLRNQTFQAPPPNVQNVKKKKNRGRRKAKATTNANGDTLVHSEGHRKKDRSLTEKESGKVTRILGEDPDDDGTLALRELLGSSPDQVERHTLGSALCCGGIEALEASLKDTSATLASQGTREGCERAAELSLWQGCAASAFALLTNSDEEGSGALEDRWLSLAPMAGYELYLKLLKLKAEEEEARKRPSRAALFFLAANEPLAAVSALEKGGRPSEALTVSRLRLEPDKERDIRLLKAWAAQLLERGRVSEGARALVAAGEFSGAVRVLCDAAELESNPQFLCAAVAIAKRENMMEEYEKITRTLPLLQVSCGDYSGAVGTVSQLSNTWSQSLLPLIAMAKALTLSGVLSHQGSNGESVGVESFQVAAPTRAASLLLSAAAETAILVLPSVSDALGGSSLLQQFLGILMDITEEQKERGIQCGESQCTEDIVTCDEVTSERRRKGGVELSGTELAEYLCDSSNSLAASMAEIAEKCANAAAAAESTQRQRWRCTAAVAQAARVALLLLSSCGRGRQPLQWRTALGAIGALLEGPRAGEEAARLLLPLWREEEEREWRREVTIALERAHVQEEERTLAASAFLAFAAVLQFRHIGRERRRSVTETETVLEKTKHITEEEHNGKGEEQLKRWCATVFNRAWIEEERATAAAVEAERAMERAHTRARAAQRALAALTAARARGAAPEAAALEAAATAAAADVALCNTAAVEAQKERERAVAASCPHPSAASATAAVAAAAGATAEEVASVFHALQ